MFIPYKHMRKLTKICEIMFKPVGFEILTAVIMKNSVFWNITPCSPLKVNRRFGGTCRLSIQCLKIIQARNRRKRRWKASTILLKHRLTFNGLHGVISQKIWNLKKACILWTENHTIIAVFSIPEFLFVVCLFRVYLPTLSVIRFAHAEWPDDSK
jgi:hypothetical protein